MSFKDFKFHQAIQEGIQTLGFTTPTPIQQQPIQHILDGKVQRKKAEQLPLTSG